MAGICSEHDTPNRVPGCVACQTMVCDFCRSWDPTWDYDAGSFSWELAAASKKTGKVTKQSEGESVDGWLACEQCHTLIEAGRWQELADRTLSTWPADMRKRADVRNIVLTYHQGFAASRIGEARPFVDDSRLPSA